MADVQKHRFQEQQLAASILISIMKDTKNAILNSDLNQMSIRYAWLFKTSKCLLSYGTGFLQKLYKTLLSL